MTSTEIYPDTEFKFMNKETKDFKERLIELVKDDKELHDATVRLINALAEQTEISNQYRKSKRIEKVWKEKTGGT